MSIDDINTLLGIDINNPASYKSGEHLESYVYCRLSRVLLTDRDGVVAVLRDWIQSRSEPFTLLSVSLCQRLNIYELISDITQLRGEIARGEIFYNYYLRWVDEALLVLNISGRL